MNDHCGARRSCVGSVTRGDESTRVPRGKLSPRGVSILSLALLIAPVRGLLSHFQSLTI